MADLPHLASRLYGTPLLIARPRLEVILGVMGRRLAGEPLPVADITASAASVQVTESGIAVIPIMGTLVRRSSYLAAASGLTSYHAIEAMAEDAFADDHVKAVLLEVDSSGGEAGGVFDLAGRLRDLASASGKPLWAIADEAALSAAYALAAAADQLWLTRTAEVGSIGVVAVHVDESEADAKAGLAYRFIHAGAHKVDGHPHAPLSPAVAGDIQSDIDALYEQFIVLAAGFRKIAPAAVRATEARVYRGESAITAGLADWIGSTREALEALSGTLAASPRSLSRSLQQELVMDAHNHQQEMPVLAAPPSDEASITAGIEARLRAQMVEITEITAQAQRLGVVVDPGQALAHGVTPDALRQRVLREAAGRDLAADIVAQAPTPVVGVNLADSPLVKAAQHYGVR